MVVSDDAVLALNGLKMVRISQEVRSDECMKDPVS